MPFKKRIIHRLFLTKSKQSTHHSMRGITSSPRHTGIEKEEKEGLLSCWGRLKLKFPWTKRRVTSSNSTNSTTATTRTTTIQKTRSLVGCCNNITAALMRSNIHPKPKPAGGFSYDPLSYAQNFDEGCWDDDNKDVLYRGFSSRFAAPSSSRSLQDK